VLPEWRRPSQWRPRAPADLEDLAHFTHQRERRQAAGMAAGTGGDQNQAIDAGFQRLVGMS